MARPKDVGRRDELEAALVAYALVNGVTDLSLRGAATALRISTYPLAYHFGSKEGLIAAVMAGVEDRLRAEVAAWAAEPGQGLGDILRRFWARCSREEAVPLFRLFFEAQGLALRTPERFPGLADRVWLPWYALLGQLAAERGVPPARTAAVAALMVSIAAGSMLTLLATGDRAAADAAVELGAQVLDPPVPRLSLEA